MPSAIRFFSDALKIVTIEPNGLHLQGCWMLQSNELMLSEKERKKQRLKPQGKQRN